MSIKKITIEGLRGFSKKTEIEFAIPDKENKGSGLTVLVGPNNSGKSTLIEAIHLLSINRDTIPSTSRNIKTNGKIMIEAQDTEGNTVSLKSTDNKGAFVERKLNNVVQEYWNNKLNTFILTSKRGFSSTFNNNSYQSRENYTGNIGNEEYRNENNINHNFGGRLLNIYRNKPEFNNCLKKVLSPLPEWTIESSNGDNLYLEFSFNDIKHSSNGAGDGYINIFNIVDSLYDSSENNVILIDEPEISLHPDLQRKLFDLLVEYSKDKQIIISTHSPYFVDWNVFSNKGKIIRFKKKEEFINIYELTERTKKDIRGLLEDSFNPHILSLNANEIFFLNDNVIVTEGQDDVLCYKQIFKKFNFESNASFFGWGAGGAEKMKIILSILYELGYEKVFTIVDNDKRDTVQKLQKKFPSYGFYAISANDVRNKKDDKINKIINIIENIEFEKETKKMIIDVLQNKAQNVEGLVNNTKDYQINDKYRDDIDKLIDNITKYFNSRIKKDYETKIKKQEKSIKNEINIKEHNVEKLLNKYIENNKLHKYIQKKYPYLEFKMGEGGVLSLKKIKDNIYYAIVEQEEGISEKCSITVNFHFIINTRKEKVNLIKRKVISNTLPKYYRRNGTLCQ